MQTTQTAASAPAPARTLPAAGIPLALAPAGTPLEVSCIRGKDDTRRFLNNLGFVEGAVVELVSELGGNVIVNVKGSRVAISRQMASRILTDPRR